MVRYLDEEKRIDNILVFHARYHSINDLPSKNRGEKIRVS